MTTLTELVRNMIQLESELNRFEKQFGIRSQDLYVAMTNGELEEFDALDEHRMSFVEWFSLYKTWLSLDEKYSQLIARQPIALQIKTNLELTHA